MFRPRWERRCWSRWGVLALILPVIAGGGDRVRRSSTTQIVEPGAGALNRAVLASRATAPGLPREIVLRGGIYSLEAPLVLTTLDSGLTIQSAPGEVAVITGGRRISGWRREADGRLWTTELPLNAGRDWRFRTLIVGGRIAARSRLPKTGFFHDAEPDFAPGKDVASAERLTTLHYRGADLEFGLDAASAELRVYRSWDESLSKIAGIDTVQKEVRLVTPLRFPPGAMRRHDYEILNVREGLLEPGQWYLDHRQGRLFYWPLPDEDMNAAEVWAPVTDSLIQIKGTLRQRVHGITLRNLDLTMTDAPARSGGFAGTDYDGAINIVWGQDILLTGLRITKAGGTGIKALDTAHLRVLESDLDETGGCALVANGGNNNEVADSRISRTGHATPAAGGIHLRGDLNHVHHNEVRWTPYSGILVFGEGAVVEFNSVHHVMRTMADGAAYYTNGTNGIVRHNWAYDVGIGVQSQAPAYYLDDLTHDYRVEENAAIVANWALMVHACSGNTVTGNTFVALGDERIELHDSTATVLEKNIFFANGRFRLGYQAGALTSFASNIIYSGAGVLEEMRWDQNERVRPLSTGDNLVANPGLANPAAQDLSFLPSSPALQLGIPAAIPLSRVGPRQTFR